MSQVAAKILNSSYARIRESLDTREVSSRELVEESLKRARADRESCASMLLVLEESALREAQSADERLGRGERGELLGIPILIKDLILVKDFKTTAASKMLENFIAPYDATVIAKLKRAGTPLIGKTNLDEFAMGSSNESSYFGPTKNPWGLDCVPGGSSGGSAAAVAARIAPLSLGTDTGGSIRQPASLCGITGLKPTYGRVSRFGVVAYASSLDQVGPMTVDVESSAAILGCIAGHCVHDSTSANRSSETFLENVRKRTRSGTVEGLRIGLPVEFFETGALNYEVKERVHEAVRFFESRGATVVPISLPHLKYSLATYYLVATAEASSNLARYDGIHYGHRSSSNEAKSLDQLYSHSRGEGFGFEVKLRIMLGTYALSTGYFDAFYKKASQVRTLLRGDFEKAFQVCDVIAGPASPTTAFKLGEKQNDPLAMYLADIYTLAANLAGIPGLSFNVGFDAATKPVGLQLMGPWWQESLLLEMGGLYQNAHPESLKLSPVAEKAGGE